MSSLKKVLNRPKKRILVRWDSDLDELLLLTIQSVCNTKNVKIPWGDVAATMRHNVTEGAIIQHLSKLRSRRIDAGKFVPPPLRRGGNGAPNKASNASTTYTEGGARGRMRNAREPDTAVKPSDLAQDTDMPSDEEYVDGRHAKSQKAAARRKNSRVQRKDDHQVQSQSGSDHDADGSPISSDELVISGAQFLEYPNHRTRDRSLARLQKRSKVVVLRYKREAQLTSDKPVKVESQEHTTVSAFEPHNQSSIGGNHLSADHSNMGMSSVPNSNSNFMDFGSTQGLHMNAFQNFYPSSQNEQLGYVPDTWNHLSAHQSEQMSVAPGEPSMYFDDVFQYIHANDAHQDDNGATYAGSGDTNPFY